MSFQFTEMNIGSQTLIWIDYGLSELILITYDLLLVY